MKLLFVKPSLVWPRSSGHDVHTYSMMRACRQLGHQIGIATVERPTSEATRGLDLAFSALLTDHASVASQRSLALTRMQERYRSYWGVDRTRIAAIRDAEREFGPDAVIVAGLDTLPYLSGVERAVRVWYAADEWVWHHLSLVQPQSRSTWPNLRIAALKGLYEWVYSPLIDRAWVVSETERRAMRWFAGVRTSDVVPNGVDPDFYAPSDEIGRPCSAVFWGRLDFEPNIQGLQWFCQGIWPELKRRMPAASLTIIGFRPTEDVRELTRYPGIELKPDLPDLRGEVAQHQIVVLPFVSGGGIKNKLLEAAALGKPIVCTRRSLSGLRDAAMAGLLAVDRETEWVDVMLALWSAPERRQAMGEANRQWVTARHSWIAAASVAVEGIETTLKRRLT